MRFQVTFKTPDALENAVMEYAEEQTIKSNVNEDLFEEMFDKQLEKALAFAKKWVRYKEYITVEFDMKNGTCKVMEV